jgi:hypothetical protein
MHSFSMELMAQNPVKKNIRDIAVLHGTVSIAIIVIGC